MPTPVTVAKPAEGATVSRLIAVFRDIRQHERGEATVPGRTGSSPPLLGPARDTFPSGRDRTMVCGAAVVGVTGQGWPATPSSVTIKFRF